MRDKIITWFLLSLKRRGHDIRIVEDSQGLSFQGLVKYLVIVGAISGCGTPPKRCHTRVQQDYQIEVCEQGRQIEINVYPRGLDL